MPTGTCRLCLTPNLELCDSHFIPRAFYKLFIERGGSGSQPITASPEVSMFSGKQASDYLLCGVCEQRFNQGGEAYLIANSWHSPEDFPLQQWLLEKGPVRGSTERFAAFEVAEDPQIDREKIAYFGTSVIWRAAVHDWHMPSGHPKRISFGRYEDGFRRYLLGETEFPEEAAMLVFVSPSKDEMQNNFVTFPWLWKREGGFHQYKLVVPGITYILCVGKMVHQDFRDSCLSKSANGAIFMTPATDDANIQSNVAMLKNSRRVGKLARVGGGIARRS